MSKQPTVDMPVYPDIFSDTGFTSQIPHLLGTRCGRCHELFFPCRSACPRCRTATDMRRERLPDVGAIYALTHVAKPAAIYAKPYVLALIDLEDGPRILGQVKGDPGKLRIGARVRVVVEPLFETPEARRVWGYRFEPF